MFEAISHIATPQMQANDATFSSQAGAVKSPEMATPQKGAEILPFMDQLAKTQQKSQAEKQSDQDQKVTEQMLESLEQDIESMHSVGLKFAKFDESGRTFVRVIDKTNDRVIREIPSEEVLKLAAKMEEMIGILFDKQA